MHIFNSIFVQFMQIPVLRFGLAHSGSCVDAINSYSHSTSTQHHIVKRSDLTITEAIRRGMAAIRLGLDKLCQHNYENNRYLKA